MNKTSKSTLLSLCATLIAGCLLMPSTVNAADPIDGDLINNPFNTRFEETTEIQTNKSSGNKDGDVINNPIATDASSESSSKGKKNSSTNKSDASAPSDVQIKAVSLSKAKIKKVIRKNSTAKITLKKIKYANGYQIKYSTSKKFKKNLTKTVVSVKLTKKIKKLKTGKKYYVKARAFVKVNGKKNFGKWSKVKTIK